MKPEYNVLVFLFQFNLLKTSTKNYYNVLELGKLMVFL